MFGIAAIVLAVLAALAAFGALSGLAWGGLLAIALACLAMHLLWPVIPWQRAP